MPRAVRWTFLLFGGLLLWRAGISIFSAPRHEVLYAAESPMRVCVPQVCTTMMRLEVGNTGTVDQENVRVRFRAEPLRKLTLPLTVRNFGKVDRPVAISESDGQRIYDLGRLEPRKRVEFNAVFHGQASEQSPAWQDILVGVEAASGETRPGDPSVVQSARLLHAVFGWL